MISICEMKTCTGCEACASVCPVHCIEMKPNKDGFYYPVIKVDKCIECKQCVRTCPNNFDFQKGKSHFFMGWHKDEKILLNSSSGGAFTAIADLVLEQGGIVFGAWFDEINHTVQHIEVEQSSVLGRLRLSKYFQSRIYDSYILAEAELKNERQVLFTGTGCQIAGLYKYLGKEYSNLLTVDVLCHGITSKKVIDAYIKSKEKQYKKKVKTFKFRFKPTDSDWMRGGGTKMKLDFEDGTKKIEEKETDTFFVGFNSYLFLRESCYDCKYFGTERIADITLADFWGIDLSTISEKQRKNGVSLIVANSQKGKMIIDELSQDMEIYPADRERAIAANQAFRKPSTKNENREDFFSRIDTTDFDELVHNYNKKIYLKMRARKILGNKVYDILKKIVRRV